MQSRQRSWLRSWEARLHAVHGLQDDEDMVVGRKCC